jgi:hypothetical protein
VLAAFGYLVSMLKSKRDFSLRGPTLRKSGAEEKASARFARNDGL